MGAANCPETPRQKMIGMMYLMLTCMLALNVSKEILDAFVVVNRGMEQTNLTFIQKNEYMYRALAEARANNPEQAGPYFEASLRVKELSDAMDKYIHEMKVDLFVMVDGGTRESQQNADMSKLQAKDNKTTPQRYMLGSSVDGSQGKARELKNELIKYKEELLELLRNPKIDIPHKEQQIEELGHLGIDTDDNPNPRVDYPHEKFWETEKFAEIPLAAHITILTQIQNQVRNAEATIVNKLLGSIGASDFKFDTIAPRIVPRSNFIVSGDSYEAELFIAAFSTTDKPTILVGQGYDTLKRELKGKVDSVPVVHGVGRYLVPNPGVGTHKFSAVIQVRNPVTNQPITYPIKVGNSYDIEYIVARPQAVISPTKMNVLYIGVPNPIDISVSGFREDQIRAGISQGTLSKSGSGYIAQVRNPGKAVITVSVSDDKGGSRSMGNMEFRVRRVPNPVPKVANLQGGNIAKSLLLTQTGVVADLENFDFDLRFNISSFTVSATIRGFQETATATSARFTPQQLAIIQKVPIGQSIYIEDVRAAGPDGTVRNIGTIKFTLR